TPINFLMTKFFFIALMTTLVVIASHHAPAQTPTPAASASDVAALREQVEALTEMVKALQQQVKDQQTLLEKANIVQFLQSEGTPSVASEPVPTPLPSASVSQAFPTTDSPVVAKSLTEPG